MHPVLQPCLNHEVVDDGRGALTEKIDAYTKKDQVGDARNQDPFPKIVFVYKAMRPVVRLDGYDNFF